MKKITFLLFSLLVFSGCSFDNLQVSNSEDVISEDLMKKIDFNEVLWFAIRAKAAYLTEEEIKKSFPNTVRVVNLQGIDVQYFIELDHENKRQIISVRGTANLQDAKEDAEYIPSKNSKLSIYVHRGFDQDALKLYGDMLPYLNKEYSVTLTGHSLGAAISTLLMMYLHEDGYKINHSINFGQPKVTNSKGVEHYEFLPLTRVVDENDLVPLVPPTTLLDSIHGVYEHLGREVILLDGEYYVYLDSHDAQRKSIDSFWKNIGRESISEHFMDNYIKNIKTKQEISKEVPYTDREKYI